MYAINLLGITQSTPVNAEFSTFEKFLADGGANDPDMYLLREGEDFTHEACRTVMDRVRRYAAEDNPRVIEVQEFDYMLTA